MCIEIDNDESAILEIINEPNRGYSEAISRGFATFSREGKLLKTDGKTVWKIGDIESKDIEVGQRIIVVK